MDRSSRQPTARSQGSAPKQKLNSRDCVAYVAQLQGVMVAATEETPPGVDTAEVEYRMSLIQAAIDEVERRNQELAEERDAALQKRVMDTHARRREAREAAENQIAKSNQERLLQVQEMNEMQQAYYKDRNQRIDEKAVKCKEYGEKVQIETVDKAAANEVHRNRNIANLMKQREAHRREMKEREDAKQEYARDVLRRRAVQEEKDRVEKEQKSLLHEQQIQATLASIRDSRRSKWTAKGKASRARSRVVFENGQAILETELKDHEMLVEELHERERAQQMRYAEDKADRDLYLQQRAQFHAMRQDEQQKKLIKLLEEREKRGEAIVKQAQEKKQRGDNVQMKNADQYSKIACRRRRELAEHQKRAHQLQHRRHLESLQNNYERWNQRAARIITELHEVLAEPKEKPGSQQATYQYRDMPVEEDPGEARAVRLPSPSDFAV